MGVDDNVLQDYQHSDFIARLYNHDWSLLENVDGVHDWSFQPAIFMTLGRCETCDGPFSIWAEIHGKANDGIIYGGGIFSTEPDKFSGLELLEIAIDKNLLSSDAMFFRAVKFCENLNSSRDFRQSAVLRERRTEAMKLGQMGADCLKQGWHDEAEDSFSRALEIFKDLDDKQYQALAYMNLGVISARRKESCTAVSLLNMALALFEEIDDKQNIASIYGMLGQIEVERQDFEKAEINLEKVLAIYSRLDNKLEIIKAYHGLGFIYKACNKKERAIRAYSDALKLAEDLGEQGPKKVLEAELRDLRH